MQVGFVALLDVLGFASLVSGDAKGDRLQDYLHCLQKAFDVGTGSPEVAFVVFSDSIVLTTGDDSEKSLQALLLQCSRTLGLMLEKEISLRGAIAQGSYFRSEVPGGVFVAGKSIIDAYTFEKAQDWVGIMLAPSAVKRVPDLNERCRLYRPSSRESVRELGERLRWAAVIQRCSSIPFHSNHPFENNSYDGFAIVPSAGDLEPSAPRLRVG